MTTATDLIQAAYREGNLIAVGTSPTSAETTEALAKLNRLINGIFGFELGENLQDWIYPAPQRTAPVAANWPQLPLTCNPSASVTPYPPKNSRIVWGAVTGTIYFPENPEAGSRMGFVQASGAGDAGAIGQILTLNGNGRTIGAANTATITSASPATAPREWFYRDDLGDWILRADLLAADTCPFPKDFDDFFICALNKRLAPSYGKLVSQETVNMAARTLKRLVARYRQSAPTVYGSENYPNTPQSYGGPLGVWW